MYIETQLSAAPAAAQSFPQLRANGFRGSTDRIESNTNHIDSSSTCQPTQITSQSVRQLDSQHDGHLAVALSISDG